MSMFSEIMPSGDKPENSMMSFYERLIKANYEAKVAMLASFDTGNEMLEYLDCLG